MKQPWTKPELRGPLNFRSEYGEDRWIFLNVRLPANGFYVDVGAMRPDANSNTAFLRDMGWHGLAIDGHPDCARHWQGVPGAQFIWAVVTDSEKRVGFDLDEGNGPCARIVSKERANEATVSPKLALEFFNTATLGMLLHGYRQIDFLSIDIEGEEFNAMTTFDFERFRPSVIVAEYATLQPDGSVKEDFRVRDLLLTKDYVEVHRTVANIVYVAQRRRDFTERHKTTGATRRVDRFDPAPMPESNWERL